MIKKIKIKHDNNVIIGLGLSLLLIWGGFYFSYPNFFELQKIAEQKAEQKIAAQKEINKNLAFGQLNLEAKAFAVYDIETGELIASQQENQILPLASITKIMTVLVSSENFSAQTPITINQTNGEKGLRRGEQWSLASLATLTLVGSSNDGATALSEASAVGPTNFIDQMNTKAQELGLTDLHFTNPTGLDDRAIPGGQGSTLSVARLFSYAIKNQPELFSATREPIINEKSLDNFNHTVLNTNEIIKDIPGLIASKTGLTDLAGGNLAIVANFGLNRPIAIVVLGSSESGRFTDTKKLVEATLNYYSNLN
ncbi:MAG: serine hydrolase [Candidatus Vogelbacteria bacterium]|nr:serine hydrolase [Candidatus Vogelbacteria bacterium]